ncbi:hypothetical protein [Micromonospora deserti]|uniref:Uncharacterized protein n=1 Tax=Micromonospora deserti TaxID=2070366 RepID=A0A2W2BMD2_9ACTN|nr:hypothetical protein [Micromonospora deserti]PZF88591.1 hypothetical protein C1I99_26235 [Micromonospora deserti]
MPARRKPKKSRTPRPTPTVADLTPADLDPVAAPDVPALPVDGAGGPAVRPATPKAGPAVTAGRSVAARSSQRAGQTRRYAFRRS